MGFPLIDLLMQVNDLSFTSINVITPKHYTSPIKGGQLNIRMKADYFARQVIEYLIPSIRQATEDSPPVSPKRRLAPSRRSQI
jgi:hypothetical protein